MSEKHWIDRGWVWALIWPLFFAAPTTINAFSVLSESAQRGFVVRPWEAFAWEYTSLAASLVAVVPFTLILKSAWPARPWWRFVASWFAAAALYTTLHVVLMVLARKALYFLVGRQYDFGDWLVQGFYEARKDFVTCLTMGGLVIALQTIRDLRRARAERAQPARQEPFVYAVGGRVYRTPHEQLLHIRASGHYVEVATEQGVRLVRRPLADVEKALQGSRLVRTHRSWLVNLDRVERADPTPSGDWDLVLPNGETAPLSRRYRQVLEQLRG